MPLFCRCLSSSELCNKIIKNQLIGGAENSLYALGAMVNLRPWIFRPENKDFPPKFIAMFLDDCLNTADGWYYIFVVKTQCLLARYHNDPA